MWSYEFAIETKDFVINISYYKTLTIQEILVIMAISSNIVHQEEIKSDKDLQDAKNGLKIATDLIRSSFRLPEMHVKL